MKEKKREKKETRKLPIAIEIKPKKRVIYYIVMYVCIIKRIQM